jgi:hypothetical protein
MIKIIKNFIIKTIADEMNIHQMELSRINNRINLLEDPFLFSLGETVESFDINLGNLVIVKRKKRVYIKGSANWYTAYSSKFKSIVEFHETDLKKIKINLK